MSKKQKKPTKFNQLDTESVMDEMAKLAAQPGEAETSAFRETSGKDVDAADGVEKSSNGLQNDTVAVVDKKAFISLLSTLGTGLWRMKKAMVEDESGEPKEEMLRPYRHLSALWDSLEEFGLQIRDHTGERIPDSGVYGLRVITYDPKEDLEFEVVIDTLKPTVILGDQILQMADVVVGIPKKHQEDAD